MPVVIQKFGGKLLETPEQIRRAAEYIISTKMRGEDPVIIVSAPGGMTDSFISLARSITDQPDERELDMLLSVGERTAMALLAMAINADGRYRAVSFTGSQVGIITDTRHTDARILDVKCYRIRETLEMGEIPIIAGFQGVSTEREITTLGRGGSDATAVALAAALDAVRCDLVKESGAVFSADPILVPEAVPLPELDYTTLEALTSAGAQVVQPRAATLAKQHLVPLSITDADHKHGTLVTDQTMNAPVVASVVIAEELSVMDFDKCAQDWRAEASVGVSEQDWRLVIWTDRGGVVALKSRTEDGGARPAVLITVVGWGGALPGEVTIAVLEAVRRAGITPVAAAGLGSGLGLLVDGDEGRRTLEVVHGCCLREGFIKNPIPKRRGTIHNPQSAIRNPK